MIRFLLIFLFLTACSYNPQNTNIPEKNINKVYSKDTTTDYILKDYFNNWFYGQGVGETGLKVFSSFTFPPIFMALTANTLLDIFTGKKVEIHKSLGPDLGPVWKNTYDGITSIPGRITSIISGVEYHTDEVKKNNLDYYYSDPTVAYIKSDTL